MRVSIKSNNSRSPLCVGQTNQQQQARSTFHLTPTHTLAYRAHSYDTHFGDTQSSLCRSATTQSIDPSSLTPRHPRRTLIQLSPSRRTCSSNRVNSELAHSPGFWVAITPNPCFDLFDEFSLLDGGRRRRKAEHVSRWWWGKYGGWGGGKEANGVSQRRLGNVFLRRIFTRRIFVIGRTQSSVYSGRRG